VLSKIKLKKNSKAWSVYMIRCQNNFLYTGTSNNVEKRIQTHNKGKGSKAVKKFGLPVTLVYQKEVGTRSEACKEEYAMKQLTKKQKEELIRK